MEHGVFTSKSSLYIFMNLSIERYKEQSVPKKIPSFSTYLLFIIYHFYIYINNIIININK